MILLLDAGNSRVKWGTLQDGKVSRTGASPYTLGHLHALVSNEWRDISKPERVVVSNVAGKLFSAELDGLANATWKINPDYLVSSRSGFGIINAYPEPKRLGVDRWAAMIAARHHFKGALYVVDCGTALTLDMLAADGQHLGGLIIPGISMMQSALFERTTGISGNPDSLPGSEKVILTDNTHDAVYAGALYAAIAVIDRVIDDVTYTLGTDISGVITGGAAPLLLPLLKRKYTHEPDLVLKGLALIAGSDG